MNGTLLIWLTFMGSLFQFRFSGPRWSAGAGATLLAEGVGLPGKPTPSSSWGGLEVCMGSCLLCVHQPVMAHG